MSGNGADRNFKLSFEWKIPYLTLCPSLRYSVGEFRLSPAFSSGFDHKPIWQMILYPCGVNNRNADTVSLYVVLALPKDNVELRAKLKCSIFNAESGKLLITRELENAETFVPGKRGEMFGFDRFVQWDVLKLRDDIDVKARTSNLKIACEISGTEYSVVPVIKNDTPLTMPESRFADNLRNFFTSNDFSDVTLTVDGHCFRAHKLILAAHSPVFSAMFKHEMAERVHNVTITDVAPGAFKEMLRFMYTGEVMDIEAIAVSLLGAADKYAVERLKVMCEEALYKKIAVANAADTLVLADKHSAQQLKPRVLTFIASCTNDVTATPGFQSMIRLHPHLVVEMIHKLTETQKL